MAGFLVGTKWTKRAKEVRAGSADGQLFLYMFS